MFLNRMEDWAMKYNGFYFWMFKGPMKKVLAKKYGKGPHRAVQQGLRRGDHAKEQAGLPGTGRAGG